MTAETATIVAAVITVAGAIAAAVITLRHQSRHAPPPPAPIPPAAEAPKGRLTIVREHARLRCGVINHPPLAAFHFTPDGGVRFDGYYVELARQVARANELAIEFVPMDWHEFMGDLFALRDIDLVLSVFETSDRREYADFTCYFHRVDLCAVVNAASPLEDHADLRNGSLRWALAKGEAGWEYAVQEIGIKPWEAIVVEHPDIATALRMLHAGGADVAIVDSLTYAQYMDANPEARLRRLGECILYFKNGIMLRRRDREFQDWVRMEFGRARSGEAMLARERRMLADCHGAVQKYA